MTHPVTTCRMYFFLCEFSSISCIISWSPYNSDICFKETLSIFHDGHLCLLLLRSRFNPQVVQSSHLILAAESGSAYYSLPFLIFHIKGLAHSDDFLCVQHVLGARGTKVIDNTSLTTPDTYWTRNLVPGPYSADSHGHHTTGLTHQPWLEPWLSNKKKKNEKRH